MNNCQKLPTVQKFIRKQKHTPEISPYLPTLNGKACEHQLTAQQQHMCLKGTHAATFQKRMTTRIPVFSNLYRDCKGPA